jgi:hypothetical protein
MSQHEIIKSGLEELLEKTRTYRTSGQSAGFFETLAFIKQSRYLAPYNALLVMQQRPDATLVISKDAIEKKFKRTLRPQVQPIIIMKHFGPVEFVYDVKDIDGIEENPIPGYRPNIPTEDVCRAIFPVDGDLRGVKGLFDAAVRSCRRQGLYFQESAMEVRQAGEVRLVPESLRRPYKEVNSENRLTNYVMELNTFHPVEIKFAALVHELAHIFCRHLNEFPEFYFKSKEKHQEEFEAEAVAYLFCYRYGFRPRSEQYLCGYLHDGKEPSVGELELILKALHRIEELLKPEAVTGIPQKFSFTLIDHHSQSEYRLILKGKKLLYNADTPMDSPRHEVIKPSLQDWDKFWQTCTTIGVWSWEAVYNTQHLADEYHVEWSLDMQLGDRQVTATGKNCLPGGEGVRIGKDYPQPFAKLLKGLKALAGKLPVG